MERERGWISRDEGRLSYAETLEGKGLERAGDVVDKLRIEKGKDHFADASKMIEIEPLTPALSPKGARDKLGKEVNAQAPGLEQNICERTTDGKRAETD